MNTPTLIIIILALAAALPLPAQEKKPTPAKTPAQVNADKLNKLKRDLRNKEEIKKAKAILDRALKKNDAAKGESARIEKDRPLPSVEDAQTKLDRLKKSTNESDLDELKNLLKDNKPALEEEMRKLKARVQEQMQKEGKPRPAAAPEPDPAPGSFESIAAPMPLPRQGAPDFRPPALTSERMIKGSSRDPRNPDKELPDSDPRTRTYVLNGNVRLRRPDMAFDADEADILFNAGEAPGSSSEPKKAAPPSPDPVNRKKADGPPIERIIARGRVRVMFVDKTGHVQVARGGHMIYDGKSGVFTIKEWPEVEIGDKMFRGPAKSSVVRLSDWVGGNPAAQFDGFESVDLEREHTAADMPKSPDKPVPAAGPIRSSSSPAPSPAPR